MSWDVWAEWDAALPRIARVVVPSDPHHYYTTGQSPTEKTFFRDDDYRAYLELMAEWCGRCGVEIRAYCLMPNHVHLIAVPDSEDELPRRFPRRNGDQACYM